MADKNIKIEVVSRNSGSSGSSPLDQYRKDLGGGPVSSQAQSTMQQMQGNQSAIPMTEKDRRESMSWMLQRNINERQYNSILNDRLNLLQRMAPFSANGPAGTNGTGGAGGGTGSGGGGGNGNFPNNPSVPKVPPYSFLGMGMSSWGAIGTVTALAGQGVNALNYQEMRLSQIEGKTALAQNSFKLREMQGDFTGELFDKERARGLKNAPSKAGIFGSDALSTIGNTALAAAAGVAAAAIIGGTGGLATPAVLAGVTMTGGTAGLLGAGGYLANKAFNNTNYFSDLTRRTEEAKVESQQAEIDKDITKKSLYESAIKSGSQKTIRGSLRFLSSLGETEWGKVGGESFGTLAGGMSSKESENTFIKNFAEATARGMDMSRNGKEISQLLSLLASQQISSGVRTAGGASDFNSTYLRSFADTTTQVGLQAGQSVNAFKEGLQGRNTGMEGAAAGAYLERTFGRNITGGKAHSAFVGISHLLEKEMTVDNDSIQVGFAAYKEKHPDTTIEQFIEMAKGSARAKERVSNGGAIARAEKAIRNVGGTWALRGGVLSLKERERQMLLGQNLAKARGESSAVDFKTPELIDALVADTRNIGKTSKTTGTGTVGTTGEGLSSDSQNLGTSFKNLQGNVEELSKAMHLALMSIGNQRDTRDAYTQNQIDAAKKTNDSTLINKRGNPTKVGPSGQIGK